MPTFRIRLQARWCIAGDGDGGVLSADMAPLVALLERIDALGSIALAAAEQQLSYRHAWGLLRDAETRLGGRVLHTQRGRGARLTPLGRALLDTERHLADRLGPTLATLADELGQALLHAAQGDAGALPAGPLRVHASHGFAVATLLEQLTAAGLPVALSYRTATEALAGLARGGCELAGFHVPLGALQAPVVAQCAPWLDPRRHVLLHVAVRSAGLFVAPGNPLGIDGVADLARPGLRFVNRQLGSGTRLLVDLLFAEAGVSPAAVTGHDRCELTHAAVAAQVAGGSADAGMGVETAARRFGLGFVPLLRERYFLAAPAAAMQAPALQAVVQSLRSTLYTAQVATLPGYDPTSAGLVQTLHEAFGDDWPR